MKKMGGLVSGEPVVLEADMINDHQTQSNDETLPEMMSTTSD